MPRYYLPRIEDLITSKTQTTCRYILCDGSTDVEDCMQILRTYLENLNVLYMKIDQGSLQYIEYLVFVSGFPKIMCDFFITLEEYADDPPDEDSTVLFSGKLSDYLTQKSGDE